MSRKNDPQEMQTIEQLTERYNDLHKRKIKAEANLTNAQNRLDELRKQAKSEYGTDDLGELRLKLDAMKKENEEKRAKYQQDLDKIEADLAAVEEKHQVRG